MFLDENFKFKASVSLDAYQDKTISNAMIGSRKVEENRRIRNEYGYDSRKGVGYLEGTYTPRELLGKLTEGHVFCQLFDPLRIRKDGTFGSSEKNNHNFRGAYVIGVDIDGTKYSTPEEFIGRLEFKPTFFYSSYRNQIEGFGARFRMMYVLKEPIRDRYHFRYFAWLLHQKIEADTQEIIKDKCGLNCSQYFNGTNKNNKGLVFSSGITNIIYEFKDFSPTKGDFLSFLNNNCYYSKSLTIEEKSDIEFLKKILLTSNSTTTYYDDWQKNEHLLLEHNLSVGSGDHHKIELDKRLVCSKSLISDMSRLEYDEFMKYNRHKFSYYYRVEKDEWVMVNDLVKYQEVNDSYFSLYYHSARILDKQKRRKKLYQRMCLRRVMMPSVDADTLLFNAYEDLHRFCDNDPKTVGNVITIDELVKNVRSAMNKDIGEIEDELSDIIEYLKSKRPKFGRIYKFNGELGLGARNSLFKVVNWAMIAENYDCSLSIKENLKVLLEQNIRSSERTLYRFCKEYGIDPKGTNDDMKMMMEHYDHSLSLRMNHKRMQEMGYKISLGKLGKLVAAQSIPP